MNGIVEKSIFGYITCPVNIMRGWQAGGSVGCWLVVWLTWPGPQPGLAAAALISDSTPQLNTGGPSCCCCCLPAASAHTEDGVFCVLSGN